MQISLLKHPQIGVFQNFLLNDSFLLKLYKIALDLYFALFVVNEVHPYSLSAPKFTKFRQNLLE
jgi:hypothetical protein